MLVFCWKKSVVFLFSFAIFLISSSVVRADGTYANIGTTHSSLGSADVVSWSQSFPIMIDSFGNYIVPIQANNTQYYWAYSNDKGATWGEVTATGMTVARPSAVYDSINDKIHVIYTNSSNQTVYLRYIIRRDKNYKINNITQETAFTSLVLDTIGTCTTMVVNNPIALWKNTGANGTLVAFWEERKTCAGTTTTEVRASMRALSNDANDGTAGNWAALNGVSDASGANGPASVAYNKLYGYTGSSYFQLSAAIKGGSGSQKDDIYFFNTDENTTNGFRRLGWSSGSSNWSGTWTTRAVFGGDVNDSQGYNLKEDLISKPVYASTSDRIYVGIARWLDNTNGDTQSLYYVDSSDNITLAGNVYSAGGAHCIYPTLDLMYDSNTNKVYFFYLISGSATVCGNTYYKTFDGSSFSTATAFYSVANRSVDIPIIYQSRDNDRVISFFRLNNSSTPGTPPHEAYFGYISLNSTTTNSSLSITSPYTATSFPDFNQTCASESNTEPTNTSGEVSLASNFHDDFETPRSPYNLLFSSLWTSGVWATGTYDPFPNGSLLVFNANGSYILGQTTFTRKLLEFRAQFTNHNFQHIGWTDGTNFNQYVIFSTYNNGQLNARVNDGTGETNAQFGSSYLGAYHKYKIDWNGTNSLFYIDDTLAGTIAKTPSIALIPIASNNTNTAGSNMTVDWLNVINYPTTTGTYQTCSLSSGTANTAWNAMTFATTIPGSTTLTAQSRTSEDNSTWSAWSGNITSGNSISSPNGRYLQLLFTLTGTSTSTPTLDSFTINFTPDTTPPAISAVSASTTNTSAVLTWTTNENSSSIVDFGMTNSYGTTTTEADTTTRVTSHSVTVNSLVACTQYHFRVKSNDAAGNLATGTDNTFNTTGCTGSSTFTNQNTSAITTAAGGTISLTNTDAGSVLLNVPASFGSSNATFQTKQLDKTSVLATTGSPTGFSAVGSHVYDFKAYQDVNTSVTSFSNPITVTITYTAADVSGYDTSTLKIYRWANSTWNGLTGCTINTTAKTVSCTTTSFSTFILFGQTSSSSSSSSTATALSAGLPLAPSCSAPTPGAKAPWLYAATPKDLDSIKLYFTQNDNPVDHYALEYGTKSGGYTFGADNIGDANTTQYTVTNLRPGVTYYFRVRAGNNCATGTWSNEISASPTLFNLKPLGLSNESPKVVPATPSPSPKPSPTSTTKSETQLTLPSLTIKVTDKQNQPVAGAKVTLHSTPRTGVTDKNGEITFEDVETGQHQVVIAYQGFRGEQSVNLGDQTVNVNLNVKIQKTKDLTPIFLALIAALFAIIAFLLHKLRQKNKSGVK